MDADAEMAREEPKVCIEMALEGGTRATKVAVMSESPIEDCTMWPLSLSAPATCSEKAPKEETMPAMRMSVPTVM